MGGSRSLRRGLSNNQQEKVALEAIRRANLAIAAIEKLRQELIQAKVIRPAPKTTEGGVALPEPGMFPIHTR